MKKISLGRSGEQSQGQGSTSVIWGKSRSGYNEEVVAEQNGAKLVRNKLSAQATFPASSGRNEESW